MEITSEVFFTLYILVVSFLITYIICYDYHPKEKYPFDPDLYLPSKAYEGERVYTMDVIITKDTLWYTHKDFFGLEPK